VAKGKPASGRTGSTRIPDVRSVALPAEHGSWGLTLEPILLGLLVAPSWAGAGLALNAFCAFLLRRPLRVARSSRKHGQSERLKLALRFAALYAVVGAAGLGASISLTGWGPLLPLLFALPFGLVFTFFDAQNQSRSWQAELAGPVALSAVATGIALAGGEPPSAAYALWAVLVARAVPSILFVRARLRLDRGRPRPTALVVVAHVTALGAVTALVRLELLWAPVAAVFVLLLLRATLGLSRFRRPVSVKAIGYSEIGWGLLTVLSVAAGSWV
jgi:hypothetical protein